MRESTGRGFGGTERTTVFAVGNRPLSGILALPRDAAGVIVFAHGSGSGKTSPRNQFVARVLQTTGLGTLLINLLGEDEAGDCAKVFDIRLQANRLLAAAHWLRHERDTRNLPLGYFGASTGAAAALVAAAERRECVSAVVSRGGRPDLARGFLNRVTAPTLVIVGSHDSEALELNRQALGVLRCPRELAVIAGATHLFPEPGALEEVALLAGRWFLQHLGGSPRGQADARAVSSCGCRFPESDMDLQC